MQGRFYVVGETVTDGSIDRLAMAGNGDDNGELRNLDVAGGKIAFASGHWSASVRLAHAGARVRRADGNAVAGIKLAWPDGARAADVRDDRRTSAGQGTVTVVQDFSPVHAAIAGMARDGLDGKLDALAGRPFRRASAMPALYARLGMKPLAWCCLDETGMPAPAMEPGAEIAAAGKGGDSAFAGVQLF
jgi:hypothetical protein